MPSSPGARNRLTSQKTHYGHGVAGKGSKGLARIAAVAALLCAGALAVAHADVVSGGNVRVSFRGWITPHQLPRAAAAPVALHVSGTLRPVAGHRPAQLKRVKIEINRHGLISTEGLPVCPPGRLKAATTALALRACRGSLVGHGTFRAHVEIPEEAPFPAVGRMLAFVSKLDGRRALVAHVYGTDPIPIAQVLPISLRRRGEGGFGATLSVKMPEAGPEWGYVTDFEMKFHRGYRYRGRARSFISASCPAPAGINEAPFRAARGTYYLAGGRTLTRVVEGSCSVRAAAP
jgi:hypothetical protein